VVGPGLALPTELILVPMLFVLPLRDVPLCVAAGMIVGDLASGRGRIPFDRIPLRLANAWHSVGPVLVLAAAGAPSPAFRYAPIFAAALGAQFVVDYISTAMLEWLRVGLSPRTLARFIVWAYAVDITLANARVNGVELDAYRSDALADDLPPADVVVANVALDVVERLLPRLDARLAITSGYLERDDPKVTGWRRLERNDREGWAADLYERA